jgi:hypothetical protein
VAVLGSKDAMGAPNAGLYRRCTAAALIVAPAIFLLDNLLHPTEYERGNEAQQLAEIASSYTRWQLAHALGFLAILVFAAAVLGLAWLVRRRQPALGLAGGTLGIAGLLGLAGVIAIDGYTWGVLGEVSSRPGVDDRSIELALEEVQSSGWSTLFYTLPLAWIASLVLLSVGVARQRAAPVWACALLVLGSVMVGTETAIVDNAYFIAGAAVLLSGGLAIGLALALMTDEEFAAGGVGGAPAPRVARQGGRFQRQ